MFISYKGVSFWDTHFPKEIWLSEQNFQLSIPDGPEVMKKNLS